MISRPDRSPKSDVLERLKAVARFPVVDESGNEFGYVVSDREDVGEPEETPTVVDDRTRDEWMAEPSAELFDDEGNVVGMFVRRGELEREAEAWAMRFFTEEMLDESAGSGGRKLEDIFRDLGVPCDASAE